MGHVCWWWVLERDGVYLQAQKKSDSGVGWKVRWDLVNFEGSGEREFDVEVRLEWSGMWDQ